VIYQVAILFAEGCRVILETTLVRVAESRIGETLIVVDAADSVGLVSSTGAESTLRLDLAVGASLMAVINKIKNLAVAVNHTWSLGRVALRVIGYRRLNVTRISVPSLFYLHNVCWLGLKGASDLLRNLCSFFRQLAVHLYLLEVQTLSLCYKIIF
jgi:hypothetical protein